MGEDEKALQIGRATCEYQTAKTECAHIEQKIERVFKAYLDAGRTMDKHSGSGNEPQLIDGRVKLGWHTPGVSFSDILNESELAIVLAERDKARKRLEDARKVMVSLGMANIV